MTTIINSVDEGTKKQLEKLLGDDAKYCLYPDVTLRYISDLNTGKYFRCDKYFAGDGKNSDIEYGMHAPYSSAMYKSANDRMYNSMHCILRYILHLPAGLEEFTTAVGKKKKYMLGSPDTKFAVWSLMRSVIIPNDLFMAMLPAYLPETKKGINFWNRCVSSINDIPEEIKSKFYISQYGSCQIEKDLQKLVGDDFSLYAYDPENGSYGKITIDMLMNDESGEEYLPIGKTVTEPERMISETKPEDIKISRDDIKTILKTAIESENVDLNTINSFIRFGMIAAGISETDNISTVVNKFYKLIPSDILKQIQKYESTVGRSITEILYVCGIKNVKDLIDLVNDAAGNPSMFVMPDDAEKESPQEDSPVVGDVVKDDVVDIKSTELKETTPTKEEDTKKQPEEKIDLSAPAKINFKLMPAVTFEPPVKDEEQKNLSFDFEKMKQSFVQTPVFSQTQLDDIYKESNKSWENRFPKLEKFTAIVHKNDLYVNYSIMEVFNTYDVFRADLISKTGVIVKSLLIDYYTIYGDGIRVGTMNDQYGDVYNELWINIYDANYVSKLINGTLTEEDTIALSEKYPPYLRDIVRMVDITELPKDIPNTKWKSFMNKIGKVIMNLPNDARFRLVNYVDTNKWALVCAPNVSISFVSKNDPRLRSTGFTNIQSHGLYIDYDEAKYKANNNYIVGNLDGSPLGFDPYGFKK